MTDAPGGPPPPPGRPKGRRPKLTPERQAAILEALAGGSFLATAAQYAGVDESTVHRWMRRGEDADAPARFRQFRKAVSKALAVDEVRDVALITKHAQKNWKAAAWKLEHKYPHWSPRVRLTVEAELDGALDKLERGLAPELYQQVLAILTGEAPIADVHRKPTGEALLPAATSTDATQAVRQAVRPAENAPENALSRKPAAGAVDDEGGEGV